MRATMLAAALLAALLAPPARAADVVDSPCTAADNTAPKEGVPGTTCAGATMVR